MQSESSLDAREHTGWFEYLKFSTKRNHSGRNQSACQGSGKGGIDSQRTRGSFWESWKRCVSWLVMGTMCQNSSRFTHKTGEFYCLEIISQKVDKNHAGERKKDTSNEDWFPSPGRSSRVAEVRFSLLLLICAHVPPSPPSPASAQAGAALPPSPVPFLPLGRSQAVWVQGSQGEPFPTESFPNSRFKLFLWAGSSLPRLYCWPRARFIRCVWVKVLRLENRETDHQERYRTKEKGTYFKELTPTGCWNWQIWKLRGRLGMPWEEAVLSSQAGHAGRIRLPPSRGGLPSCAKSLSRVRLFATPWTAARQPPLSMGFSRQEYWSGLPRSPPGDLPDSEIKPASLRLSCNGRRVL